MKTTTAIFVSKNTTYFMCFVLALSLRTLTVCAQDTQIFMDNEGRIEIIDRDLNARLALFTDYEGFKEAKLFEVSGNEFMLEIYYKLDKGVLRKRIPYTLEEVKSLRDRVSGALAATQSEAVLDQNGRVKLLVASTAAGLGYYGWAIPIALHMKSGKAIASTYMFTGALSFFIPYRTTINSSVTESAANAYVYGTTRGALHGYILNSLVYGNDFSPRRAFGFSVAGSVGEGVGFYKLTSAQNWSAGKVELLGVGGDFGFGIGVAAPFALNYENKNRVYAASMLIGTGTGFVAANYLSGKDHYTQGYAFVIRGAGMMGSYVSLSAMNLIQPKNERWYAGIFIAGSLSGLYLGNRLVDEKDFTPAQGTFIEIGQLAGWLTGLGIAYLIQDPAKSDNSRLFMTMSAIGGMSGYTLMYRSFADKAQKKAAKSSWNLRLTPQNLLLAKFYRSNTGSGIPMPVAALDVTF